ncbi:hypothetical protein I215_09476 [Galbibacter marinus]|uniref:Methylamine utilisation protein MauE domain-containing protein n=1 Tax=Galbibacter marinus TaxID=555500 RepID=K2QK40_9FLAO|nr:MauE/DoxX family redox-associated membrane protein [Galbibacter marinus]EKF55082.1 hypothetical protein I215_09476 [Galbibacter marinus]
MKWRRRHNGITVEIISILYVVVFAFTGLTKLMEGDRFFNNLNNSPILPDMVWLSYIISWVVPTLEIVIALLIAIPRTRLKGLYSALGLMIAFTIYVVGIVFISPYAPCSCGGIITLLSWPQHLIFNVGLIILALVAIRFLKKGPPLAKEFIQT